MAPLRNIAALVSSLGLVSGDYPVSPSGNPIGPDTQKEDVSIPADVLSCSGSAYAVGSDGYWSYQQIARAFYEYSVKPWNWKSTSAKDHVGDCVAALLIVAGECNPGISPGKGCDAAATGASGVFQTDFMRTGGAGKKVNPAIGGGPMNLCISAFGAGFMAAPFPADAGDHVSSLEGSSYFTCRGSLSTVKDYHCDDPAAVAGNNYSNFIGPFCHKAHASRWSPCPIGSTGSCCAMWNGGGNSGQAAFPGYYFKKGDKAQGDRFEGICQDVANGLSAVTI